MPGSTIQLAVSTSSEVPDAVLKLLACGCGSTPYGISLPVPPMYA